LWLSPMVYALLGGEVIQSGDLSPADRVWLTIMPGYVGSRQRTFLDAWEATHPTIQSRDWELWVRVRLYAQGD
jgi:hypothetical protein